MKMYYICDIVLIINSLDVGHIKYFPSLFK